MPRVASFVTAVGLGLLAAASTALASPVEAPRPDTPEGWTFRAGERVTVDRPGPVTAAGPETISRIIWLNRCEGNCTFTKSATQNNALTNSTFVGGVAVGATMTITPFAQSEAVWTGFLACMREVYGPYNVEIVTTDPGAVPHHEAVVAGRASDMSITGPLGVSPIDPRTCAAINNGISFTFANDRGPDPIAMCWTTAQESAHSFGLDHAFDCSDPLTYLDGCGQKFFRNKDIRCGEFAARDCKCGPPSQNSHQKLLATFGKGVDPAPPTVSVASPPPGPVAAGFSVFVSATDRRGVAYVQLFINGWKWAEKAGAGPTFVLDVPGDVPDGVMDLRARACNDLDICADAPIVTVTRGAPCTDAAANCLAGQQCEAGKCFWQPASVDLGGACSFDQECLTEKCADAGDGPICTQTCFGPPNDRCPEGFACSAPSGAEGFCGVAAPDDGGCCSTQRGAGRGVVLVNLGLGAMIGLLVARRRRKR